MNIYQKQTLFHKIIDYNTSLYKWTVVWTMFLRISLGSLNLNKLEGLLLWGEVLIGPRVLNNITLDCLLHHYLKFPGMT